MEQILLKQVPPGGKPPKQKWNDSGKRQQGNGRRRRENWKNGGIRKYKIISEMRMRLGGGLRQNTIKMEDRYRKVTK